MNRPPVYQASPAGPNEMRRDDNSKITAHAASSALDSSELSFLQRLTCKIEWIMVLPGNGAEPEGQSSL
jgi:hypothetical protein